MSKPDGGAMRDKPTAKRRKPKKYKWRSYGYVCPEHRLPAMLHIKGGWKCPTGHTISNVILGTSEEP